MNWLQKETQSDMYDLRRDGKLIMRGSEAECYYRLQRIQSQSADWAMKYEGYTINPISEDWRDHYIWFGPEQDNPNSAK
jgi:hypothetical protein